MTRDEILAKWDSMTPRERDALVAEKVMGWKDERPRVFAPSTQISAAWEVVEKMGPFTQLTWDKYNGVKIWHCSFSVIDSVDALTVPEAICKAALLAVLEEIA